MKNMRRAFMALFVLAAAAGAYYGSFYFRDRQVSEILPQEGGEGAVARTMRQGSFQGADRVHQGSGTAALIALSDEERIIRFENFRVTNGPDLYVYLAKNPEPSSDLASLGDYISLGRLKGNVGDQNYPIAADAEGYDTVVIWCEQFGVLFAHAVMQPVL